MSIIIGRISKSIGVAGALVTISDVMQPLAPLVAFIIPVSLILLLILIIFKSVSNRWSEELAVLSYFSFGLFFLSSFVFLFQDRSDNNKNYGMLSSAFQQVVELQKTLGIISDNVVYISNSLSSIDLKIDSIKKETSLDPRKEVANFGLSWSEWDFLDTLGDPTISALYINGGMKASGESFENYVLTYTPNPYAFDLIISGVVFDNPRCPVSENSAYWYDRVRESKVKYDLVKAVCDSDKIFKNLYQEEKNYIILISGVESYMAKQEALCTFELNGIDSDKWLRDAIEYQYNRNLVDYPGLSDISVVVRSKLIKVAILYGVNTVYRKVESSARLNNSIFELCKDEAFSESNEKLKKLNNHIGVIRSYMRFWKSS